MTLTALATLAWWLIPIGATLIAVIVVALVARHRRRNTGADYDDLHRFQDAMRRSLPQQHQPPEESDQ